jgi:hypothetical protein
VRRVANQLRRLGDEPAAGWGRARAEVVGELEQPPPSSAWVACSEVGLDLSGHIADGKRTWAPPARLLLRDPVTIAAGALGCQAHVGPGCFKEARESGHGRLAPAVLIGCHH